MDSKQNQKLHRCLDLEYTNFISIFDQFNEGIVISDHEGKIVYYNDTMGKIDDMSPEFAIGKRVTAVYDVTPDTSMILQYLNRTKSIINVPFFYRTRIGKVVNTIHSVYPLFKKRKLIGAIMFVKDLSSGIKTKKSSDPRPNLDYSHNHPLGGARLDAENIGGGPKMMSLPDGHLTMERNMIRQALIQHGGNVTHAAGKLGISRQLLHYKMKKYRFERKSFVVTHG